MIKDNLFNIVLLGAPGCGKGTQAHLIEQRYALEHISTGDLYRKEIANKTELGLQAKQFIEKGELCPDEMTLDMLYTRMVSQVRSNGFVFDGVPRTIQQAQMMQGVGYHHQIPVSLVFYLSVNKETVTERIAKRKILFDRPDDAYEVMMQRFVHYENMSKPLEEFYGTQNKLVEINALQDVESVFFDIAKVIDVHFK